MFSPQAIAAAIQDTTRKLDVRNADLRTILERISHVERLRLDMPSDIEGMVSVTIEKVTLIEMLSAILYPLHLDYTVERDILHVRKEIRIKVEYIDLQTLLTMVCRDLNLALDMPDEFNYSLALDFDRIRLSALLRGLLDHVELEFGFDRGTLVIWKLKNEKSRLGAIRRMSCPDCID